MKYLTIGMRVELDRGTDLWLSGDQFGFIISRDRKMYKGSRGATFQVLMEETGKTRHISGAILNRAKNQNG